MNASQKNSKPNSKAPSPEATPKRDRSTISPTPSENTPKNTPILNSSSRHSFLGNAEKPKNLYMTNPYNSPIGNTSTPDSHSGVITSPNDYITNTTHSGLPNIVNSSMNSSTSVSPGDNYPHGNAPTLRSDNFDARIPLGKTSTPESYGNTKDTSNSSGKIVISDSPINNSSTPQGGSAPMPLSNPPNPPANPPNPPTSPLPLGYNPSAPPGAGNQPQGGNAPGRDPVNVALPQNLSALSLGLAPPSYRSSVFYLAITKFVSTPFIIFLFFIVRIHGKKPTTSYLLWMIGVMLFLELLHGSLLLYGAMEKKLTVIKFCIWFTLFMGSYNSAIGILGVMTFISLAHYTLQFFFVFMFVVLICNIFTVIFCDVPVLVCYKKELIGQSPHSRYLGTYVNYTSCRI